MCKQSIQTVNALLTTFPLETLFSEDDKFSVSLLRLMLAADDANHITRLLLVALDDRGIETEFDKLITNGETLHLFRLLCGHLYEAGIAFDSIEQSKSGQLLDEAVQGNTELEFDLKTIREAYRRQPDGAFHAVFLKPIRNEFGFHYKEESLKVALGKHLRGKDLVGTMVSTPYLGLGRYTICDHLVTSAIQDVLGVEWNDFRTAFDDAMGRVQGLSGALVKVVNQLLTHIFSQREGAIISNEVGTVSVPFCLSAPHLQSIKE